MIILKSFFYLVSLFLTIYIIGNAIKVLVLRDNRYDLELDYLNPLIGLGSIIPIIYLIGFYIGFQSLVLKLLFYFIFSLLALGLVYFRKVNFVVLKNSLIFLIFCTIPVTGTIIMYGGFNPFTDAFTYLMHGQYLQENSFNTQVDGSGFYPALSQIKLYQHAAHRMGGSLFLGFAQFIMNEKWAYYVYVPVVGVVFASGLLTLVTLFKKYFQETSLLLIFIACLALPFSQNGFVFGAQYGFLPQTFGLSFILGTMVLSVLIIDHFNEIQKFNSNLIKLIFFNSVFFSAFLYCYNDMAPFIIAIFGLSFLIFISLDFKNLKNYIYIILTFFLFIILLVNFEFARIVSNFLRTVLSAGKGNVGFGWPVLWEPIQFYANTFGLKSPFANDIFKIEKFFSKYFFILFLVSILVIIKIYFNDLKKYKNFFIVFICSNLIFFILFLKFRYFTLPYGFSGNLVGTTFLQYKLAGWMSVFNLPIISFIFLLMIKKLKGNLIKYLKFSSIFIILMGVYIQGFFSAKYFTKHFLDSTRTSFHPFKKILQLRKDVKSTDTNKKFYLNFSHHDHKLRQMIMYVLYDEMLMGNYKNDGYISGHIKKAMKNLNVEDADYVIGYNSKDNNKLFEIVKLPGNFIQFVEGQSEYQEEKSNDDSWYWVNKKLELKYKVFNLNENNFFINFDYMNRSNDKIFLKIYEKKKLLNELIIEPSINKFNNIKIQMSPNKQKDITVVLTNNGNGTALSQFDKRKATMMIKNFRIHFD